MLNKRSLVRTLVTALAVVAGFVLTTQESQAIPAYSNRTGLPCMSCHTPVYARLTKLGWQFRRLGYRLPSEMGKTLTAGSQDEGEDKYSYADTISIMSRMRFDSIHRDGAASFSQFYPQANIAFFSGPADKNWGYFLEPVLQEQAPTFVKADSRFELPESEFEMEFAAVKYFSGTADKYFSAKIGQFGFGGVDGFMGNDRPVTTGRPQMFTSTINSFQMDATQRGLDVGYTTGDNHVGIQVLNGVNFEGHGDVSRPGNSNDFMFQALHFFPDEQSSVQFLYYNGKTPMDADATASDKFNRFYLLGNYRKPMGKEDGINLLGGYMKGSHDRVLAGPPVSTSGSFDVNSWFVEADYETANMVPYFRYDVLHSDEYKSGGVLSGNPNKDTKIWTVGFAKMLSRTVRGNVEYQNITRDPGAEQNLLRFQLWFMW